MRLLRIPQPFDHADFLFEPKLDGFRALAHIRGHRCELVSRNGHVFKSWPQLAQEIAHAVLCRAAILDGEICCLEPDGTTNFNKLLFRREWPWFYAFDALSINGRDLRSLPLSERKERLRGIMSAVECRVLFLDSLAERGRDLFRAACERDLAACGERPTWSAAGAHRSMFHSLGNLTGAVGSNASSDQSCEKPHPRL